MVANLEQLSELNPEGREVPARIQREAVRFVNWMVANGMDRPAAAKGVQEFLLAVMPAKKKQAKAGANAVKRPEMLAVMARYEALYRAQYGEAPQISPVDWAHVSMLRRDYSTEVIIGRLEALSRYVKEDAFMARVGFSLGALRNQWNRVTAYTKQRQTSTSPSAPSDCRHIPRCETAHTHTKKTLADSRSMT